jgi:hypothetical protein
MNGSREIWCALITLAENKIVVITTKQILIKIQYRKKLNVRFLNNGYICPVMSGIFKIYHMVGRVIYKAFYVVNTIIHWNSKLLSSSLKKHIKLNIVLLNVHIWEYQGNYNSSCHLACDKKLWQIKYMTLKLPVISCLEILNPWDQHDNSPWYKMLWPTLLRHMSGL